MRVGEIQLCSEQEKSASISFFVSISLSSTSSSSSSWSMYKRVWIRVTGSKDTTTTGPENLYLSFYPLLFIRESHFVHFPAVSSFSWHLSSVLHISCHFCILLITPTCDYFPSRWTLHYFQVIIPLFLTIFQVN